MFSITYIFILIEFTVNIVPVLNENAGDKDVHRQENIIDSN